MSCGTALNKQAFMGLLYMGCHVIYGLPLSLDRFFSLDKNLDIFTESGGLEILSILASALIGSVFVEANLRAPTTGATQGVFAAIHCRKIS